MLFLSFLSFSMSVSSWINIVLWIVNSYCSWVGRLAAPQVWTRPIITRVFVCRQEGPLSRFHFPHCSSITPWDLFAVPGSTPNRNLLVEHFVLSLLITNLIPIIQFIQEMHKSSSQDLFYLCSVHYFDSDMFPGGSLPRPASGESPNPPLKIHFSEYVIALAVVRLDSERPCVFPRLLKRHQEQMPGSQVL